MFDKQKRGTIIGENFLLSLPLFVKSSVPINGPRRGFLILLKYIGISLISFVIFN